MKFVLYRGVALSQVTKKSVHWGLSEVASIEGCPHVRGGLYERSSTVLQMTGQSWACSAKMS